MFFVFFHQGMVNFFWKTSSLSAHSQTELSWCQISSAFVVKMGHMALPKPANVLGLVLLEKAMELLEYKAILSEAYFFAALERHFYWGNK